METLREFTPDGDRYIFDFKLCRPQDGWAQLDTKQDASYYGNWVNPIKLQMASYCEGDITLNTYESESEFIAGVTKALDWHDTHGWGPAKIDGMCDEYIIAAFARMGLANRLH